MDISIIGPRAFPADFIGTSGVEKYISMLAPLLHEDNLITIYTRDAFQKLVVYTPIPGIQILPIWCPKHKILESLFYSFVASILAAFSSNKVVWYHGMGLAIFSFIPKLTGKKVVLTIHSLDWKRKKWNRWEKALFTNISHIVGMFSDVNTVVSKSVQTQCFQELHLPTTATLTGLEIMMNMQKLPSNNLFQENKYDIKDGYMLYLGRFVPEKRLEWLLLFYHVYAKVAKKSQLVLAGGSSYTDIYVRSLQKKYAHPNVTWLGYVFGDEKQQLISKARCIVIPSELEGLPLVALEGITHKKHIVIASSCIDRAFHSLPIVHTFKQNSFIDFSRAVLETLTHTQDEKINLVKIADIYSWKKTAMIFQKIFHKIASR